MTPESNQIKLRRVYDVFDAQAADTPVACHRGCAACCTRNVTLTRLEARLILETLDADALIRLHSRIATVADLPRLVPKITTNGIADACASGRPIPEEPADPAWSPCPLLVDDECSIYPFRPFHCRCMLSQHDCRTHGHAQETERRIAMNTLFLQVIEHLDYTGVSANLIDMLGQASPVNHIANRPARILMIPPEHRDSLAPVVAALEAIVAGGETPKS